MVVVVTCGTLQSLHEFVNMKDVLNEGRTGLSGDREAGDAAHNDVLRVVERFALLVTESGVPRMPARVFAYLLAADADRHTAGELAAGLRVSPAAISGALRYLQMTGFLIREREPGARTDSYRLRGDLWSEMYISRMGLLERWEQVLGEGAELLGPGRSGSARMREAQEFLAFARADLPAMMERWHEHRRAVFGDDADRSVT
jgi:DNA-binding transcriptional ArsR family regulator